MEYLGRINGIFWTESEDPGYARFYLSFDDGVWAELTRADLVLTQKPKGLKKIGKECRPAMGCSIVEIRADDDAVALLLSSGGVLSHHGTFDGEMTGNNVSYDTPEELAGWGREYKSMPIVKRMDPR